MTTLRDGLYRYLMLDRDPLGKRGGPPRNVAAEQRDAMYAKPSVKQKREAIARVGYGAVRHDLGRK